MVSQYVPKLMGIMHRFTPKGRDLLLDVLKKNRQLVDKRYGFATELPSVLLKDGSYEQLTREYCGNLTSIFDELLVDGLKINPLSKYWKKSSKQYLQKLEEIITKNLSLIEDVSIDFEKKKAQIIKMMEERNLTGYAKQMKSADNPESFSKILMTLFKGHLLETDYSNLIKRSGVYNRRNGYSLDVLKEMHTNAGKEGDLFLEIQRAISPESVNPKIRKIEDILRTKYGMDFVHIGTEEEAEKILKAVEIAAKEGIPLPKHIATSGLTLGMGGYNTCTSNLDNFVFFNPQNCVDLLKQELLSLNKTQKNKKFRRYLALAEKCNEQFGISQAKIYSTESPLHIYMHELVHSEAIGKTFANQLMKKLSKPQQKTAMAVSSYAGMRAGNMTEEVRTELRTKQILSKYFPDDAQKLSKKEEQLLDYLS